MKIGVDVDGVILNFERDLKVHGELYNFLELGKAGEKNKNGHYVAEIFGWNPEENVRFENKYFLSVSEKTPFMPGAVEVLKMLRADGHELIVISARGGSIPEMKDVALKRLSEVGLVFDKYYWAELDKEEVAKKEQLDLMIDDHPMHCEKLANAGIKTLYFKDVNARDLEESDYITEVTNWGEIYKIIKTKSDLKK